MRTYTDTTIEEGDVKLIICDDTEESRMIVIQAVAGGKLVIHQPVLLELKAVIDEYVSKHMIEEKEKE